MGKAFTEAERNAVQEKLRRTGLVLFAEKGIRGVSIRDLTAAAGIAQGGFYTFYENKEAFLADLIVFRIREKLGEMEKLNPESLADPAGFLSDLFFREGMHLRKNRAFDNTVSGFTDLFFHADADVHEQIGNLYRDYLGQLLGYWQAHGLTVRMDMDGMINLIRSAGVLFSNAALMTPDYFEKIYRCFCESEVRMFVQVTAHD